MNLVFAAQAVLAVVSVLATNFVPTSGKRITETDEYFMLPEGFLFGAGISALQTEGAWNEDGREPTAVESFLHGNVTGFPGMQAPDVAADFYHRWQEDIALAKELKVFRFSVSWPRVLPGGNVSRPNKKGVDFYHKVIDGLLAAGIQPMITMNHFDLPLSVTKRVGSWTDIRIVSIFEEYADFLFNEYGDKVKLWTTVNEPNFYCMNFATFPIAGLPASKHGDDYKCLHNFILAHMRAYRLYDRKYRQKQQGRIGAPPTTLWFRANSSSYEDVQAAERANVFALGSIFNPIVFGDYPDQMKELVEHHSAKEGLSESRLPRFTEEEKRLLKGSADFLCFNAYVATMVVNKPRSDKSESGDFGNMQTDRDIIELGKSPIPGDFSNMFSRANPWVIRDGAMWIRDNYNMSIFITENGWGDESGVDPLNDSPRIGYHSEYLYEVMRVIYEENVDVVGYLAWSLLDSYEWTANYERKFGLVHVDYEGGSRNRTLKKSAWFFQEIGKTRKVRKVKFVEDKTTSGSSTCLPSAIILSLMAVVWHM